MTHIALFIELFDYTFLQDSNRILRTSEFQENIEEICTDIERMMVYYHNRHYGKVNKLD